MTGEMYRIELSLSRAMILKWNLIGTRRMNDKYPDFPSVIQAIWL